MMDIAKIEMFSGDISTSKNLMQHDASSFNKVFEAINNVNANIVKAEKAAELYAVGETDNLHQVMIAISKAKTSFETMAQIRSRVVEGVQELMKMSI